MRDMTPQMTENSSKNKQRLLDEWRKRSLQEAFLVEPYFDRICHVWISSSQARWACEMVYWVFDDYLAGKSTPLDVYKTLDAMKGNLRVQRIWGCDDPTSQFHEEAKQLIEALKNANEWTGVFENTLAAVHELYDIEGTKDGSESTKEQRQEQFEIRRLSCLKYDGEDYEKDRVFIMGSPVNGPTNDLS